MNKFDYPETYALVPVYEDKEIYGYVACKSYIIDEMQIINDDGTSYKKYEIVYAKDVNNLCMNNYENLQNQTPLFVEGKCQNSIITTEIYSTFELARELSAEKSNQLFEKLAKDKFYPPPSYAKDLYGLKKLVDIEKTKLSSRLNELEIIEKNINGQTKRK